MPPQPGVHVGVAAIVPHGRHDGRVLILKRAATEGVSAHGLGTFGLPGGWVDYDETAEEAVKRELVEEVGLTGYGPTVAGVVTNTYPEHHLHVVCVMYRFAEWSGLATIREPDKASEIRWANERDLRQLPLFPPLETFINKYPLTEETT